MFYPPEHMPTLPSSASYHQRLAATTATMSASGGPSSSSDAAPSNFSQLRMIEDDEALARRLQEEEQTQLLESIQAHHLHLHQQQQQQQSQQQQSQQQQQQSKQHSSQSDQLRLNHNQHQHQQHHPTHAGSHAHGGAGAGPSHAHGGAGGPRRVYMNDSHAPPCPPPGGAYRRTHSSSISDTSDESSHSSSRNKIQHRHQQQTQPHQHIQENQNNCMQHRRNHTDENYRDIKKPERVGGMQRSRSDDGQDSYRTGGVRSHPNSPRRTHSSRAARELLSSSSGEEANSKPPPAHIASAQLHQPRMMTQEESDMELARQLARSELAAATTTTNSSGDLLHHRGDRPIPHGAGGAREKPSSSATSVMMMSSTSRLPEMVHSSIRPECPPDAVGLDDSVFQDRDGDSKRLPQRGRNRARLNSSPNSDQLKQAVGAPSWPLTTKAPPPTATEQPIIGKQRSTSVSPSSSSCGSSRSSGKNDGNEDCSNSGSFDSDCSANHFPPQAASATFNNAAVDALDYVRRLQEQAFSAFGGSGGGLRSASSGPIAAAAGGGVRAPLSVVMGSIKPKPHAVHADCSSDFEVARRLQEEEDQFQHSKINKNNDDKIRQPSAAAAVSPPDDSDSCSISDPYQLPPSPEIANKEKISHEEMDKKLAKFMQMSGASIRKFSSDELLMLIDSPDEVKMSVNNSKTDPRSQFQQQQPPPPPQSSLRSSTGRQKMPSISDLDQEEKTPTVANQRQMSGRTRSWEEHLDFLALDQEESSPERTLFKSNGSNSTRNVPASAPSSRRFFGSASNLLSKLASLDLVDSETTKDIDVSPMPPSGRSSKNKGPLMKYGADGQVSKAIRSPIQRLMHRNQCQISKSNVAPLNLGSDDGDDDFDFINNTGSENDTIINTTTLQRSSSAGSGLAVPRDSGFPDSPGVAKRKWISSLKGRGGGSQKGLGANHPAPLASDAPSTPARIRIKLRKKDKGDGSKAEKKSKKKNKSQAIPAAIPPAIPLDLAGIPPAMGDNSGVRRDLLAGHMVCAACGASGGSMINALNRKYHVHCFRCRSCNGGIDAAEPFAFRENELGERHPYHRRCFAEAFGVRCSVCRERIPANDDGTVSFVKHVFFDNELMCIKHADPNRHRRCTGCHRFESEKEPFADLNDAGRCVCYACCRTVVVDNSDLKSVWSLVLMFLKRINLPLWKTMWDIPVYVVQSDALTGQMCGCNTPHNGAVQIMARGLCLTDRDSNRRLKMTTMRFEHESSRFVALDADTKGFTYMDVAPKNPQFSDGGATCNSSNCRVYAILCLSGLPRDLTAGILAHEAAHAWIKLHPEYDESNPILDSVEEGCAQLVSFLMLTEGLTPADSGTGRDEVEGPSDEKLRQYFKHCIEKDESDIFGNGYRKALKAYKDIGLEALLSHVVRYRDFPET